MGKCSGNMKTCFVLALVASIALGALATTEVEPFDAVSISEDDIGEAGPADHGELARDLHVGLGEAGADPVKAAKAGLKAAIKQLKPLWARQRRSWLRRRRRLRKQRRRLKKQRRRLRRRRP